MRRRLTGVDLVRDDQDILREALWVWDIVPIGLEWDARNAESHAGIDGDENIYDEYKSDHS